MDGDLQDDPVEIPRFLEALENGVDLVSGWKKNRQDPLTKKLPSKLFNLVTSMLTGIKLRDLIVASKLIAEKLSNLRSLRRSAPLHSSPAHANGFRVGEIAVNHRARCYGNSKYSFERFYEGRL